MEQSSLVGKVFSIFIGIYGWKWTDSRSTAEEWDVTRRLWTYSIEKFSEEFVEEASYRCQNLHPEKPPSSGEFIQVCKLIEKEHAAPQLAPTYTVHKIEDLTMRGGDSKVAQEEIRKIKSILGGKMRKEVSEEIGIPFWPKEHYERTSKTFRQSVFDERKAWLLAFSESASLTLPLEERYDRISYLRQDEGDRKIESIKVAVTQRGDAKNAHKANSEGFKKPEYAYKPWARGESYD